MDLPKHGRPHLCYFLSCYDYCCHPPSIFLQSIFASLRIQRLPCLIGSPHLIFSVFASFGPAEDPALPSWLSFPAQLQEILAKPDFAIVNFQLRFNLSVFEKTLLSNSFSFSKLFFFSSDHPPSLPSLSLAVSSFWSPYNLPHHFFMSFPNLLKSPFQTLITCVCMWSDFPLKNSERQLTIFICFIFLFLSHSFPTPFVEETFHFSNLVLAY